MSKPPDRNPPPPYHPGGQDDAEALATWQFLGARSEQLYLLSEPQLQRQCEEKGERAPAAEGS